MSLSGNREASLIFYKKYDIIYIESEGKISMSIYHIKQWLRNFRWDYPCLFYAFTTFVVMISLCIMGALFFGPMILAGYLNCGWPLLLEFITIPTIVGGVHWVCECYEF